MRKYLNKTIIIISLIILGLIIFNYSNNNLNELDTEISNFQTNSVPGVIEITNPTFKSKGVNTNSYEISAIKGIQIKNDIELYEVTGKFIDNEKLVYINADKGLYNQENQLIELIGNVLIYDNIGNQTSTKSAIIDIDSKKISLLEDVISISNTLTINSNSSYIDEKKNIIKYIGNVKAKIKNK